MFSKVYKPPSAMRVTPEILLSGACELSGADF